MRIGVSKPCYAWRGGWMDVKILLMTWPARMVWVFLKDRGACQGMYCMRTIGLDGIPHDQLTED